MLELNINADPVCGYRVLCLGAHCDDIEIGCGGTILKVVRATQNLIVHWVVFSSDPEREQEARDSANAFLAETARKTVVIHNLRDGFFPYIGAKVKECFEQLKHEFSPDLIFTHYREDLHQDHRIVSELTWNTFRNHLILEYEIPKYDGDFGSPNVFVSLDDELCQRKAHYLLEYFKTQRGKPWFSRDLFSAVLRLRGMEANALTRHAEAFYCRKMLLGIGTTRHSEMERVWTRENTSIKEQG